VPYHHIFCFGMAEMPASTISPGFTMGR
jgi:hypothetical protein